MSEPSTKVQPSEQAHRMWFGRHPIWTVVLVVVLVAVLTGAVLCTIY